MIQKSSEKKLIGLQAIDSNLECFLLPVFVDIHSGKKRSVQIINERDNKIVAFASVFSDSELESDVNESIIVSIGSAPIYALRDRNGSLQLGTLDSLQVFFHAQLRNNSTPIGLRVQIANILRNEPEISRSRSEFLRNASQFASGGLLRSFISSSIRAHAWSYIENMIQDSKRRNTIFNSRLKFDFHLNNKGEIDYLSELNLPLFSPSEIEDVKRELNRAFKDTIDAHRIQLVSSDQGFPRMDKSTDADTNILSLIRDVKKIGDRVKG